MEIGKIFLKYRKKLGYSLVQMGKKIGYSKSQINYVEKTNKASEKIIKQFLENVEEVNEKEKTFLLSKTKKKKEKKEIATKEYSQEDIRFLDALEYNYIRRNETIFLIKELIEENNLKISRIDLLTSWDEKDKRKLKKMIGKLIENLKENIEKLERNIEIEEATILEEEV